MTCLVCVCIILKAQPNVIHQKSPLWKNEVGVDRPKISTGCIKSGENNHLRIFTAVCINAVVANVATKRSLARAYRKATDTKNAAVSYGRKSSYGEGFQSVLIRR